MKGASAHFESGSAPRIPGLSRWAKRIRLCEAHILRARMPPAAFLGNRTMNSSTPVALSAASGRGLPGDFWPKIERFLEIGMLVPVLGPGVITFGENDQLLYPWVTA